MKIIIQIIILIWFIGIYPRELQEKAPSMFLIFGILLYIFSGVVWNKYFKDNTEG